MNNWPERIWLQRDEECAKAGCGPHEGEDLTGSTSWCRDKINETDVEYVRCDTTILRDQIDDLLVQVSQLGRRAARAENELAAYLKDEMVKITMNLSPSATEGAIRAKLISLGWSPPQS